MSNLALYRKYRPQDFSSVYGQETITRILKNQIETDRVGHAYLFSGIRGTGKTTIAKIFARAVNCENPQHGNPCGECPTCKALSLPSAMDIIEIDAASNRGVDEIRDLRDTITYPPSIAHYKVYIIDEVHMLTKEAFNALLKTLEEPPEHAIFLLATTEPAKLPATILSRCQKYDVRPISDELIVERMDEICRAEGVEIEKLALGEISIRAGHSMRDALSLLDQCLDLRLPGELITEEDVDDFLGVAPKEQIAALALAQANKDGQSLIENLNIIRRMGKEDGMLLQDLANFYKQLLYYKITGQDENNNKEYFEKIAPLLSTDEIYKIVDVLLDAFTKLKYNALAQIVTDTALLSICAPSFANQSLGQGAARAVGGQAPSYAGRQGQAAVNRPDPIAQASTFTDSPFPETPESAPSFEPFSSGGAAGSTPPPIMPSNKAIPKGPVKTVNVEVKVNPPQASQQTGSRIGDKPDLGTLKKNLVSLAKRHNQSLLSMMCEGAEYKMNQHGLFILVDDKHAFMFHSPGFSDKLQSLVNEALGRPVKVYPKLKSKYYEHFGNKEAAKAPGQVQMNAAAAQAQPQASAPGRGPAGSMSLEDRVKEAIGDDSIVYEKEAD